MTEVEDTPLKVDDTFPSKEILLIRTAEEANFAGCSTSAKRSDDRRLHIIGIPHSWFCMSATFSPSYGWKVTRCDTRIAQPVNDDDIAQEEEVGEKGDVDIDTHIDTGEESEQSEGGDEFEEEGNPDWSDADVSVTIMESKNSRKTRTSIKARTPIKARWIYPFIKCEIVQTPNMSNREMKNLLAGYVKEKFMTISLIQNARSFARDEIFGDPLQNVMFANGLVDKIEESGHDVVMVLKERLEVMKMLERVVLSDEMRKQKAQGKLMKKKEKIEYVMKWKKNKKNKKILDDGGLLEPKMGDFSPTTPIKFMSGIFISISAAQRVVPHLQRVFQADACHMNLGKYTLYSCYGTTANCGGGNILWTQM